MCRVVEIVKAGGIERTQGAGVNTGKARLTTSAQARAIGAGVNGMERGRNTMATEGAGKGNVRAGVGGTAKAGGIITTTCCFFSVLRPVFSPESPATSTNAEIWYQSCT